MKKLLLIVSVIAFALSTGAREPQEGWKQLGTGTFCDDMFSALSEDYLDTWNVEIEESESQPGMYRLVNPFGNGNCPYFEKAFNGNDLVIDATDPEHVWIPWQDMGFSVGSWGNFSITCMNGLMVWSEIFTIEELIEYECEFGKLVDGRITFPQNDGYRLQPAFSNYLEGLPLDGNTHDRFLITLPATSGIGSIAADENTPVEYYNLQGVKVENPTSGYYIRRQGGKSSKVLFR